MKKAVDQGKRKKDKELGEEMEMWHKGEEGSAKRNEKQFSCGMGKREGRRRGKEEKF